MAYALNGSELTYFYPRPPRGGRPPAPKINARTIKISIHALREEGDEVNFAGLVKATVFLSTPSARRATSSRRPERRSKRFLSTPSARRATRRSPSSHRKTAISIHALREEGDRHPRGKEPVGKLFLSTPSARRATAIKAYSYAKDGFLSTPSARRATPPGQVQQIRHVDFYPRPPRGGRRSGHRPELARR